MTTWLQRPVAGVIAALLAVAVAACAPHARPETLATAAPVTGAVPAEPGEAFIRTGQADGLSVAIIEHGAVRFLNFGRLSRVSDQRPSQDTVYEIGSITKVFGSLLLAHAVTEGRIDLQDDIRRYLPGDHPNLEHDGTPVRVAHLAATTSALPDNIPDLAPLIAAEGADRAPFRIAERWTTYSNADLLRDLGSAALLDRPGTTSRHSNVAASVLGIILERVYGEPFDRLVTRYIEQPLGMGAGTGKARASDFALGYNGNLVAMPALDNRYILSAGGLRYSSADMARFVQAQLRADRPAIRLSQSSAGGDTNPALGFNWRIAALPDGTRVLRASGGTFGGSSYVEIRPEFGYGIVLLTNRSGAESALYQLAGQFRDQSATERNGQRMTLPIGTGSSM